MKTFIDYIRAGHLKPAQITEWIAAWHENGAPGELIDTLGFSRDEFQDWEGDRSKIDEVVAAYNADRDLQIGSLQISHGICGNEQEAHFMNATLVTERDTAVSFAVSPPDEFITKHANDFNAAMLRVFSSLVQEGWTVQVIRGADEAVEIDDVFTA